MSEIYVEDVAQGIYHVLPSPYDAVRVEVIKNGLKIAISVGWPDDEDDEGEEDE